MPQFIQTNCTYLSQSGKISIAEDFPNEARIPGISQLNIFSDEELSKQINSFIRLVEQVKEQLVFKLVPNKSDFFWTIWAQYPVLKLLQANIKSTNFDYLMWPQAVFEPPKLMLFDMDSTFIQIEVIDELARCHQVGEKVSLITESAMRGELDFAQSLVTRVNCLKGLHESTIEEIANDLPLSPGVVELVNAAKSHNCETAIVSGGFMPFVERLKDSLMLYKVKANHLEICSGHLTGKLLGDIVDAKAKAIFLQELCLELNILPSQVLTIGDGANDLLMMQAAGFNLAYFAKPKVQAQANGRMNHTRLDLLIALFAW